MKIKFNDLSIIHDQIKKDVYKVIKKTIKKNSYILSNEVKKFENDFRIFCSAGTCDNVFHYAIALYSS